MATKNDITGFTIESYGNVKIKTYAERGEVTHEYYSVPVSIIKKFINASKAPTLKDFEEWISDDREKKSIKDSHICSIGTSFWHQD